MIAQKEYINSASQICRMDNQQKKNRASQIALALSIAAIGLATFDHFRNKEQLDKLGAPMLRVDDIVIDSADENGTRKVLIYLSNYSHSWAHDVNVVIGRLAFPYDTTQEFLIVPRNTKCGTMPTNCQVILTGSMGKAAYDFLHRKKTRAYLLIDMDCTDKDKVVFHPSFAAVYNYENNKFLIGNGSLFEER